MAPLEEVGDGLWVLDGSVVSFFGFRYPTRMAIARLRSGALWLWSPVALEPSVRRAVESLGEPRYAVEPNSLHHLALAEWTKAWPSLRLWAPPALAKKRRDLRFEGELGDEAPAEWRGEIDQLRVEGSFALTEVLFFHRASRTCLVGDLIQRFDLDFQRGWRGWMMRANDLVGPSGSTPREWRATFLRRERARRSIERALAWNPAHLVVAHGVWARGDGAASLRASMRWLLGS